MSQEQDKAFFRNFAIVTVLIAVAMVLFMVLGRMLGIDDEADVERRAKLVAERTSPVGEVSVEGDAEVANAAPAGKSGEEVYNTMCVACHSVPGIGAPVTGTPEDWTARLEKGTETLYNNAINGFTGPEGFMMPARGGGQFSDDEVKAAVDYMIVNSGGEVAAATETAAAPAGKSGEEVYNAMCVACHSVAAIAPATGDTAEWGPRIEKGMETLYSNAINGFTGSKGLMPPRGGGQFSDDEVKAAVDYMVEKSQ